MTRPEIKFSSMFNITWYSVTGAARKLSAAFRYDQLNKRQIKFCAKISNVRYLANVIEHLVNRVLSRAMQKSWSKIFGVMNGILKLMLDSAGIITKMIAGVDWKYRVSWYVAFMANPVFVNMTILGNSVYPKYINVPSFFFADFTRLNLQTLWQKKISMLLFPRLYITEVWCFF